LDRKGFFFGRKGFSLVKEEIRFAWSKRSSALPGQRKLGLWTGAKKRAWLFENKELILGPTKNLSWFFTFLAPS
jgi:hypothetical protein